MHSGIIVMLVLVALAIGALVYLEMHSRRNQRSNEQQPRSEDNECYRRERPAIPSAGRSIISDRNICHVDQGENQRSTGNLIKLEAACRALINF